MLFHCGCQLGSESQTTHLVLLGAYEDLSRRLSKPEKESLLGTQFEAYFLAIAHTLTLKM